DPHIAALLAFERRFDWTIVHFVDGKAAGEILQLGFADLSEGAHAVAARPAGSGKLKMPRELAIICQKQKPFRIEVEPSHRNQARQAVRKACEDGGPAFGILMGGNKAPRLMIAPKPGRLAKR